ncbi:MAG TPA: hypothetical protein VKX39_03700 [Bryobacteraceae bacterium]|jgi:hypothetical protein|nr:hypothetical protein [Bryobacteraceae bacterium]
MKKIALSFLLLAAVVLAAAPRVSRASLRAMESSLDERISRLWNDVPYLLIGPTRGVYLEGYGAVFTAEVHLVSDRRSLMAAAVSKADVAQAHQTSLERIPVLKKALREALVSTAASLDTVPGQEQIAIVAFLDHYPWEDVSGMPASVMVTAPKGKLLEAQRAGNAESVIQVSEN